MTKPEGPALVWCPFPNGDSARQAANTLLDEGLIACANLIPAMTAIYQWQGERGEAEEYGALFKTDAALLDALVARLETLHPYDEPAILGWRCDAAAPATSAWLSGLVN